MRILFFFCLLLLFAPLAFAREDWQSHIPDDLRSWVPWVIKEREVPACPFAYNAFHEKFCGWPATLSLTLDSRGGKFTLDAVVNDEAWVPLPGNEALWPQGVQVDGRAYEVVTKNGRPSLFLKEGEYTITGEFPWNELPESLPLPQETGITSLQLEGENVPLPTIDGQGNLWLKQKKETQTLSDADHLETKIFRHLTDSIPFEVQTRLVLHVSGKNRELQLKGALLPGFAVKDVQGMLPVRLEENGVLRVKAKPGTWTVDVTSYATSPIAQLSLPAFDKPWPENEIWVFESQPALRVVDVTGVVSIDPRQTELPPEWHHLPAYLLQPQASLELKEKKRGDSEPQPDMLSLTRELWLDFDGKGYTAKDRIDGAVHQSSRISAGEGLVPGRVSVNGQDQFITLVEGDKRLGVGVQRGPLALSADSRMDGARGKMKAVGWAHDVGQLSATLYMPPGWKLFAAGGVDKASRSWVGDWTLFDIFLVLFATIALVKLLGLKPGLFGLAALVLVHTELPGLGWLTLFIVAMVALERVLPEGWFRRMVHVCRWAALIFLVLLIIPFMLYHMRDAIHPQLQGFSYGVSGYGSASMAGGMDTYRDQAVMQENQATMVESLGMPAPPPMAAPLVKPMRRMMDKAQRFEGFYQYDPSIAVQTGFGVANWRGSSISLLWNGPVTQEQMVNLWLLSPGVNLFLACLRVLLLLGLLAILLEIPCTRMKQCWERLMPKKTALGCVLAGIFLLAPLSQGYAEEPSYPPPALLGELKTYVTTQLDKQPECMPQCADIAYARLQAEGSTLMLYLAINTAETTAVPLPDTVQSWHINTIAVNGKESNLPLAKKGATLWLALEKGVHDVVITGTLPERDTASIQFPLKPHHAEYQAEGWELHGIHEDGTVDPSIQLVRSKGAVYQEEEEAFPTTRIPPFFKVERSLSFGTSWTVDTRVVRLTPGGATAVVSLPLLKGESVTTEDRQVKNGRITLQLGPDDYESFWSSQLKQTPEITLEAGKKAPYVEAWRLHTTNLWHVQTDGLPRTLNESPVLTWQPWPGERLLIKAVKPKGAPGPTKTIDKVAWNVNVGKRALDAQLAFTLRSSKGGQHQVTLPEKAVLQSLSLNGIPQPLQQEGRHVVFPLSPGIQEATLSFKQPHGIATLFKTPEVNLGLPSVNVETVMTLPQDRWVLFTGGSPVGPAVLFWGVFPVVVALSLALGMVKFTPLRFRHWLLLLLGMSQAALAANILVVGWLLVMGFRQERGMAQSRAWLFNTRQVALGVWALVAVVSLFIAIKHGLLGTPDMKITGNGSSTYYLKWYQDMADESLPRAWAFSVPVIYYRLLMLAWALWLAFAFTGWLKWGWKCFSSGGTWRKTPLSKGQQEVSESSGNTTVKQ